MENNDMLSALKGLLGDGAEEKIATVMNALGSNNQGPINVDDDIIVNENETSPSIGINPTNSNDGLQYLSQIKNIVGQMGNANDSRSNLLMSLKPYMREERKKSIDNLVKVLNISKMTGFFK